MELFKELSLGKLKLKNRIFLTPITSTKDEKGIFSKKSLDFLEKRAEGGVGLIFTGGFPLLLEDSYIELDLRRNLKELIGRIHKHDAKLCLQINPGSKWIEYNLNKNMVNNISKKEMKLIIYKIGKIAKIAKEEGIDAVEINASAGNLLDQFHTEIWNNRIDNYGGNLENRLKFSIECIEKIKENCGSDYPVLFKFTPYHGTNKGTQLDEGKNIAKILEKSRISGLHIDIGYSDIWYKSIDTVYQEEPGQIDFAFEIKKEVHIPVLTQGKLSNPEIAEKVLKDKKADLVGLGHQLIADSQWAKKVRDNKTYDIVHCISCNDCLGSLLNEGEIKCSVNPLCFNENNSINSLSMKDKKILVVGGGPGGITAAITANNNGAKVELWEKTNRLGGNFLAAGNDFFKKDIRIYMDYLIGKLYRSSVEIKLLKEGNEENINIDEYDKIIIATGSKPSDTPIKGRQDKNVCSGNDILLGDKKFGKKVAVVGGGLVGCEVAAFCAEKSDKVYIIEILEDILVNESPGINDEQALRNILLERKVKIYGNSEVVEIKNKEIIFKNKEKLKKLEIDTVIMSEGYISNNDLYKEIGEKEKVVVIGDAVTPANVIHAIHQGFREGSNL